MKTLVNRKTELEEFMSKQNILNTQVCGDEWTSGICSATSKPINWSMAIGIEWAEFFDSFDWKHWKAQEDDTENAIMELVDIFHFLLSEEYLRVDWFIQRVSLAVEDIDNQNFTLEYCKDDSTIQYLYEYFKANNSCNITKWVFACHYLGVSFDDIKYIYDVKYALNQVRLMRGYREGDYRKEWSGEEDNVVAVRVIHTRYNGDKSMLDILLEYYDEYIANEGDGDEQYW